MKVLPLLTLLLFPGPPVLPQGSDLGWNVSAALEQKQALDRITANSLRGHVSFMSSDVLQGRPTPSSGQDIAAEYIASQFRRAGLEPAGNEGYFQIAPSPVAYPNPEGFRFHLNIGKESFDVSHTRFRMNRVRALEISKAPLVRIHFSLTEALPDSAGKVIIAELPQPSQMPGKREDLAVQANDLIKRVAGFNPLLVVLVDRYHNQDSNYFSQAELILPKEESQSGAELPVVIINEDSAARAFDSMAAGSGTGTLSMYLAHPLRRSANLRNVVGLLRGSDPVLGKTYVLVSAHYDGTGPTRGLDFDAVWNAANDDGSGTAAVMEIASALATFPVHPRRSVVFLAFFGEEKGLLGSEYYAKHPLYPIEATVASINLEQLGRTDSTEGDQTNRATLTGFDYTDMAPIFQQAGIFYGIAVHKDKEKSDEYFMRSDNFSFAALGIPAHTLCVAFDYSDYHAAGDEWEKIDYESLRRTTQMAALATLVLAGSDRTPRWDGSNRLARAYQGAWQKLHKGRTD